MMFSEKRSAIKRSVPAYWNITRGSVVLLCTRIRTIAARNRTTALTWTICHEINATWTATSIAMERRWDPSTRILVTLAASVYSSTMSECIFLDETKENRLFDDIRTVIRLTVISIGVVQSEIVYFFFKREMNCVFFLKVNF